MKTKKALVLAFALFLVFNTIIGSSFAIYQNEYDSSKEFESAIRAEETEWHFRMNSGHLEKRLWSITRGIWLTDWIPVP